MSRPSLRSLAAELSTYWRELGSILASRRLQASLHPELGSKLTPSKLRALDLLAEHGGLRIGELADRVGVDDTTATRMVDRIEELGLAQRGPVEGDRRAIVVELTEDGHELVSGVLSQRHQFFVDVLATLDPDERVQLVRLTEKAALALHTRSAELVAR